MVAMNDTVQDFESAKALRQSLNQVSGVNRSGRIFLGTVLMISAIGLWAVPVSAGDGAMQLIKLLISIVLVGLGAMFISSVSERSQAPDIMIDVKSRALILVDKKNSGANASKLRYRLDELTDVSLNDRLFTARTEDGALKISVPIKDRATHAALSEALRSAA